jgi:hypothetical protein
MATLDDPITRHNATVEALGIGALASPHAMRDAVHVAICPMVAAELLSPGEHVSMEAGKATQSTLNPCIGIVDPFLKAPVKEGERFYVWLYPGSITGVGAPCIRCDGSIDGVDGRLRHEAGPVS